MERVYTTGEGGGKEGRRGRGDRGGKERGGRKERGGKKEGEGREEGATALPEVPYPGHTIFSSRVHVVSTVVKPEASHILCHPLKHIHLCTMERSHGKTSPLDRKMTCYIIVASFPGSLLASFPGSLLASFPGSLLASFPDSPSLIPRLS